MGQLHIFGLTLSSVIPKRFVQVRALDTLDPACLLLSLGLPLAGGLLQHQTKTASQKGTTEPCRRLLWVSAEPADKMAGLNRMSAFLEEHLAL